MLEIFLSESVGATAAGMASIAPTPPALMDSYAAWLAEGNAAGMNYLHNHQPIRRDPSLLLDGAKSIVSIAFNYTPPGNPENLRSKLADYSLGSDYHDVVKKRLREAVEALQSHTGGEYRICVDSAPIFERLWAERCGIGRRCDNGLISVPGCGTRVFLAEVLSTVEFPAEPALRNIDGRVEAITPRMLAEYECTHCGRCRRSCPGGALQSDGTVDARRCISYLTIEHRGEWDPTGSDVMRLPAGRDSLYGCDRCQHCCPLNAGAAATTVAEFLPRPEVARLTATDILALDQPSFSRLFKGSAIKRAKLDGLRHNALNARPSQPSQSSKSSQCSQSSQNPDT
ncbi:MAG: tRNA epoxyqueuosine(34) reductase QueG [Muribaculaceae bacterium]|nr:tRNA epoxyqueuosine(34) reductase QueG [Muribaculaceae bacterium]